MIFYRLSANKSGQDKHLDRSGLFSRRSFHEIQPQLKSGKGTLHLPYSPLPKTGDPATAPY